MPERTELDPARWRAARELFDQLVDLAPARRAQRLAETERTDPELHREVQRLLAADAAAGELLGQIDDALAPAAVSDAGSADPLSMVGHQVGHFRVVEPIASGGMGVVYRAEDERLKRTVALKLPLPHYLTDAGARRRFLREGRAAGALDHPNVCAVHEVGETGDGHLYIAMALCTGETLKARLAREGALPPANAIAIAQAIARGLGAAHAAGVVHRDVKPGNVMLLVDGGVKVLDFGLALVRDLDASVSRTTAGTAAYMAPEQIRGESVDPRADLWALGVVLYEMLAGRPPFAGDHQAAVTYAIVHEAPVPLPSLCPDVPRALDAIVGRLLVKDPARRTAAAAEVDDALDAALAEANAGTPRRRRSAARRRSARTIALAAGAFVAAAAGIVFVSSRLRVTGAPRSTTAPPPTTNTEALTYYRRGHDYESRPETLENLESARQMYQRAVALDSTFALAHARLAIVLEFLVSDGAAEGALLHARARVEAATALRLQPGLSEGHLARAYVLWDKDSTDFSLAEFRRAVAANPQSAEAHHGLGQFLQSNGRYEDAVMPLEWAVHLDSTKTAQFEVLALTQSRLRRYRAAIATWDRFVPLVPEDHDAALHRGFDFIRWRGITDSLAAVARSLPSDWDPQSHASWARFTAARMERRYADALAIALAMQHDVAWEFTIFRPRTLLQAQAYADMGDQRHARELFRRARGEAAKAISADSADAHQHAALGLAYAGLGERARAAHEADRALALSGASAITSPFSTSLMADAAEIRARIGDVDGALALLARLLSTPAGHEASVALLRKDPVWDPLRADPRFEQMLRRFATP